MKREPAITRKEKKSETIEVRLSHTEKIAFMDACRAAGTTASQAIRGYIDDFLNPRPLSRKKIVIFGLCGALVIMLFGMSVFLTVGNGRAQESAGEKIVRHFDADSDTVLSQLDKAYVDVDQSLDTSASRHETLSWLLETLDQDGDGQVTAQEIDSIVNIKLEFNTGKADIGGEDQDKNEHILLMPAGMSEEKREAFLAESGVLHSLSAEELARLMRLIDALIADGTNQGVPSQE